MLLAVDMGNTDIVIGLHNGESWVNLWRNPSHEVNALKMRLSAWIEESPYDFGQISKSVFSTVVPTQRQAVWGILKDLLPQAPLIMGPELYQKFSILIDNPSEIGSDLVANAIGAYHKFKQACVVVDFGTALSFTVVSDSGEILGVSIAPGLRTSMNALFSNTAQLKEIPLQLPETVIGKNTIHSLQAGILLGYVGLVKEILDRVEEELGVKPKIIATGGLVRIMTPLHETFDEIDQMHTLEGLRYIAEKYYPKK